MNVSAEQSRIVCSATEIVADAADTAAAAAACVLANGSLTRGVRSAKVQRSAVSKRQQTCEDSGVRWAR